jgi:hypothetical protein
MMEFVYDSAAEPIIRERFPYAQIEDASDYIHENRIQVSLPDADRDAFYKHAIREGYCDVCLGFQVMIRTPEGRKDIERCVAELKAEKADPRESAAR